MNSFLQEHLFLDRDELLQWSSEKIQFETAKKNPKSAKKSKKNDDNIIPEKEKYSHAKLLVNVIDSLLRRNGAYSTVLLAEALRYECIYVYSIYLSIPISIFIYTYFNVLICAFLCMLI
jgi:hypothetical protein